MSLTSYKLKEYLKKKKGFFIEVGSFDGINNSNTLFLEKKLKWRGILIEPNFQYYLKCIKNRQRSIVLNCALTSLKNSQRRSYISGDFFPYGASGKLMASVNEFDFLNFKHLIFLSKKYLSKLINFSKKAYIIQLPLSKILDELNISNVDFLSLDTEGSEYNVLLGIDFNKVGIKYICVEVRAFNKKEILNLLHKNNFKLIKILNRNLSKKFDLDSYEDLLFKKIT